MFVRFALCHSRTGRIPNRTKAFRARVPALAIETKCGFGERAEKAKNGGNILLTRFVRRQKTNEKGEKNSRPRFGKRLAIPCAAVSDNIGERRMRLVSTQTKLLRTSPKEPETQPQSPPAATENAVQSSRQKTYWGDRLTLKIWLLCFGLMLAMNLVEAIHQIILFLIGRFPAP
jgi:hypothetical protein